MQFNVSDTLLTGREILKLFGGRKYAEIRNENHSRWVLERTNSVTDGAHDSLAVYLGHLPEKSKRNEKEAAVGRKLFSGFIGDYVRIASSYLRPWLPGRYLNAGRTGRRDHQP